jgi:phosphoribosyl 1,2-cyclic phosphodiesterase
MNLKLTRLHLLDKSNDFARDFKSGVSLHCHTQHSREMLDFIPHYAAQIPIVKKFWERERKSYFERNGREIDFSVGYWTPPLAAGEIFNLERGQINRIGLEAIVSLTDHD